MTNRTFTPARRAGGALTVLALLSSHANASVVDDTALTSPPGVYYGSGNSGLNHGWTVDTENGVELGLGVNNRGIGGVDPTPNTNIYNVSTGYSTYITGACPANTCAIWNFEYSVLTTGMTLDDITPSFTITNLTTGKFFTFDPAGVITDNDGWTGSAVNHQAVVGGDTFGHDIGVQNSENLTFGFVPGAFDFNPLASDSYLITVTLTGTDSQFLATVSEEIRATPLPAALPLFAGGLGLFGVFRRKRKRKLAVA